MKNKIITLFLGLAVIITAGSGTPRLTPWDAWRMAYTTFEQGEEFRDKGEYTKAKESFDKALSYYRMVRSARPDWNQRVISERIADCERESQKMTAFLGQESSSQSTPSASSAVQQARASETEDLRRELAEAKAELEELYRKAAVFALPSRWESFGIVLAEALFEGCYLVGSDCIPPLNDLIGDAITYINE